MAKEDKYILWGIGLPILCMVFIWLGFDRTPPAIRALVMLVLLLPSPILVYLAKREAFDGPKTTSKITITNKAAKTTPTANGSKVVDTTFNQGLRKLAWILRAVSLPLVFGGWNIIKNTTRVWYYILGGAMLLMGVILGGASVGFMKVANE